MPRPKNPAELDLMRQAILLSQQTTGCCEWREESSRRIRDQPPHIGLTPEGIKELLVAFVANDGGEIVQVEEKREEYQEYEFYYRAIIPVPGLRRGLFVELVLEDDDPDFPAVLIVNAHEQGR